MSTSEVWRVVLTYKGEESGGVIMITPGWTHLEPVEAADCRQPGKGSWTYSAQLLGYIISPI